MIVSTYSQTLGFSDRQKYIWPIKIMCDLNRGLEIKGLFNGPCYGRWS